MAKLIAVCRDETDFQFERRQIPLMIEDALTMVMEIPETNISTHYVCENELKPFVKGYQCLSKDELSVALMVRQKEVFALLAHSVPCLGCRRSVERLYRQLVESQQPALEPLIITNAGILTISRNLLQDPKFIYALFYIHGSRLNEMVDNIPKSRRNRRCPLHSLETHKSRPSGSWIDVWDLLSQECRDEVVLIDSDALLDTLESYLRKHRFCSECKSKVLRAYNILAGDLDGPSEKGYCAALYDGLKSCPQERHIHVLCDTDFIAHLIGRAEPELAGGRERHAKTLDIAQEEVLTCLGIHLWERLHRLWQKLRAEEQTWQMLFFLGVDALRKHFEVSVENKNGISRLEQVVEEISEAERLKEMKREQKRLKKKARRREKCKCKSNGEAVNGDDRPSEPKQNGTLNGHSCPDVMLVVNGQEESCEEEDDRDSVDTPCSCEDLQCGGQRTKRATNLRTGSDCGYVNANKVWSGRETQDGVIGTCQRNERWESVSSSCLCPQDAELSIQESGKTKKGKSGNTKGKKGHPAKGTKTGSREKGVRAIDDEEKRLLQSMGWTSDSGSCKDCGSSDDELLIPEQEIERFRANQQSVSIQRQELREKLREKFQNMTLKEVPTMKGSHPLDSRQINGVSFGVVH